MFILLSEGVSASSSASTSGASVMQPAMGIRRIMARASDLFMDALGVESIIKSCFHFHLRSDPLSGSIKPELL